MATFTVNGNTHSYDGAGDRPLLWYLREDLNLVGAKFGCGIGQCGACTVHIDGVAVRSCSVPMDSLDGEAIETVENLGSDDNLHPVQKAWVDFDVPQCGYCQAGQIMAVTHFLKENPNPTDADIDQGLTNICRCGTYTRMRKAIHHAAKLMASGEKAND
jgi:isoquinoline 1-oxidoreductase alpha subunit